VRSIDIDLRKTLEFRPERGELRLGDQRMLLLNRGALRALYDLLWRDLGAEMSRSFLMQLGRRWGEHDFETLNRAHEWDTEQDRLFAGPVSHMWEGVVHVEPTTVDFDRAAGRFLLRGIWRNSYEVDLHRELRGPGRGDHCMCLAGYASGWASAFFEQPLLAIETACVSHGAPHCTFEIRPEAEFGPEATLFREALARTTATTTGQLQAALDASSAQLSELHGRLHTSVSARERQSVSHGAFVATMSHELRTPAAAIIGLAESLTKTTLNPAQRRSVTMLRESAESLVAIVHDILDFTQIDSHAVELTRAPMDLRAVVDEAAAAVDPRARDKGLTFFVTTQDGFVPRIMGDAGRIRQVMICLCTTAVKLTDAGAVVVTLKTPEPVVGGLRYVLEVNDTGAGIPAERLDRLFDAFAHIGDESSPRDGSSGLGLAICRRVARLMGGDLEIESVMGQGSTFRFWFEAQPAPAEKPAREITPVASGAAGRPLRVLVVEDNPVLLFLLREQLTNLGQASVACTGGREALEELSRQTEEPFDVIFADLHMPVLDGFEFTRQLRALPLPRQPYVVALTADAAPRQRARCLAEGFDDFAIKPLSQEGLVALLAHIGEVTGGNPPGDSPAIDETALHALRTNLGSSELLLDLIATFIRDANELLALFASSNDVEARRAAHSLKSTAMAVGARALSSIAAEAEKGQPAAAIPRAKVELGRVETALRAVRL
jgi:signal transduction histidine kinase/DNA-binding response OmpR family regulator